MVGDIPGTGSSACHGTEARPSWFIPGTESSHMPGVSGKEAERQQGTRLGRHAGAR